MMHCTHFLHWIVKLVLEHVFHGQLVHTLEEVQEHILFSIKVGQLTMAHMFQDQLYNPLQKVSIIQHALQEWLYHISGCYP